MYGYCAARSTGTSTRTCRRHTRSATRASPSSICTMARTCSTTRSRRTASGRWTRRWKNSPARGSKRSSSGSRMRAAGEPRSTSATRADRGHTFVGGSSFGAMVSLAALLRHGDVFGGAALLSPAFWWDATVYDEVRDAPFVPARLWMDVGDSEGDPPEASRYVEGYQRMLDVLRSKGYDVRGYVDRGGVHHETAWARRFPEVVRFLLAVAG